MNEILENYPLTPEQVNMVKVFMILYGYETLEELLAKSPDELEQEHKDWNEDIAQCITILRENQP
jgi:hypothetical protein